MKFTLTNLKSQAGALCPEKIELIRLLNNAQVFIETGTYLGETALAMSNIFCEVYTIELSEELHKNALKRFSSNPKVHPLCGDSAEKIAEAARMASDDKIIFWLDAHWSGGNTARADTNTPILEELMSLSNIISDKVIILIDDIRLFNKSSKDVKMHETMDGYPEIDSLLSQIKKIFPSYDSCIIADILLIYPHEIADRIQLSNVLMATNLMRSSIKDKNMLFELEKIIASADGSEKQTILDLPDFFKDSLQYGIGADYLYWRALVFERNNEINLSKRDIDLARKCGIKIPKRDWEK